MGDEQAVWTQLMCDLASSKNLPDLKDRVHWVYLFELNNAPYAGTVAAKTWGFLDSKDPSELDSALRSELKATLERLARDQNSEAYLKVL
jgi:hypothetical protein